MITSSPHLEEMKRDRKPGECFGGCGRALIGGRSVLCGDVECLRLYRWAHKAGQRAGGRTFLRSIIKRTRNGAVVRLELGCGHVVRLPRWRERRRLKRHFCERCANRFFLTGSDHTSHATHRPAEARNA